MAARLTQQRRVRDEAFRSVTFVRREENHLFEQGRCLTVPPEEAPANSVPAAAVIRGGQALSGIIGRKGRVGGMVSQWCKPRAQL